MTVTARELKAQIAEMERKVDAAEQAGQQLDEEYGEKIKALAEELADKIVSARERKIEAVLEAAVRAGKLMPSQRDIFAAHLVSVPSEKFEAELEKRRVDFGEAPQVLELGVEHGDSETFDAPGSGEDPQTRGELEDEVKRSIGPQATAIDSSGIRESIAEDEALESEEVK